MTRYLEPGPGRRLSVVYYLLRADNAVKIGTSICLPQRRKQLQYRHGPLRLLAWEPGDRDLEQQRRWEFAFCHLELEWFRRSRPLSEHIRQIRAELAEAQQEFGPNLARTIGATWPIPTRRRPVRSTAGCGA